MNRTLLRAAVASVLVLPCLASADAGGPLKRDCASLAASLSYPETAFTSSAPVAAGTLQLAGRSIPAHCVLQGKMQERVSPVDGKTYAIGFEMRLPMSWNGR